MWHWPYFVPLLTVAKPWKYLWSYSGEVVSDFIDKTDLPLVCAQEDTYLGSTALAAVVSTRRPNFPQRKNRVLKKTPTFGTLQECSESGRTMDARQPDHSHCWQCSPFGRAPTPVDEGIFMDYRPYVTLSYKTHNKSILMKWMWDVHRFRKSGQCPFI